LDLITFLEIPVLQKDFDA
jgi:hypothetical protein